MMTQPEIYRLEYASEQRWLFMEKISRPRFSLSKEWILLAGQIEEIDAGRFIDFMEKKYVSGRVKGRLPEADVVVLEFQLFFKLKDVKRKLVR